MNFFIIYVGVDIRVSVFEIVSVFIKPKKYYILIIFSLYPIRI